MNKVRSRNNVELLHFDQYYPLLFTKILERATDGATSSNTGISIQGMRINNSRFEDDIVLLEENPEDLSGTIDRLRNDCKPYGMMINLSKKRQWYLGRETWKRH